MKTGFRDFNFQVFAVHIVAVDGVQSFLDQLLIKKILLRKNRVFCREGG
jgi:hypothetical protein